MEAHLVEWLQLITRWLHVLAGAAWVGTSFYFTWLNHSLRPPDPPASGIAGRLWSVHGGGFYAVDKYAVAPERLPADLHWFKWEAYVTWLTGFSLLVLVYYLGSGGFLRDPSVSAIGQREAILLGVGTLIGGWIVYDALCRSPVGRRPIILTVLLIVFGTVVAYGLARILSPRAALIHTGAMLGTWMAANVFFVIIPGQRAMVRAMTEGGEPDPERGRQGAMRSLHNNYITLPVLFTMVGIHYPVAYVSPNSWAILAAVFVVGILARLYYNLKHAGRHALWLMGAAGAGMVALVFATVPRGGLERSTIVSERARSERVAWPIVRAILDERCVPCHADRPTWPGIASAGLGVVLEHDSLVWNYRDRIERVITTATMPLGNVTGMTPEERALLVRWLQEGSGL